MARSRRELRAGRLLQSEGCKTKLLLCFCESFQAGNLQAGRQAQDLSEREPSIVTHFAQPHVPYPWAGVQQDGGWWGRGLEAHPRVCVFQCLCVSICKCEDWRVSGRKAANVFLPPRGRAMSEPGHTEARRRKREQEVELALPRPPP